MTCASPTSSRSAGPRSYHLDIRHQLELMSLLAGTDQTVLVALHDLALAARYCDRPLLLSGGELVADGSPGEVLAGDRLREVYEVDTHIGRDDLGHLAIAYGGVPDLRGRPDDMGGDPPVSLGRACRRGTGTGHRNVDERCRVASVLGCSCWMRCGRRGVVPVWCRALRQGVRVLVGTFRDDCRTALIPPPTGAPVRSG